MLLLPIILKVLKIFVILLHLLVCCYSEGITVSRTSLLIVLSKSIIISQENRFFSEYCEEFNNTPSKNTQIFIIFLCKNDWKINIIFNIIRSSNLLYIICFDLFLKIHYRNSTRIFDTVIVRNVDNVSIKKNP